MRKFVLAVDLDGVVGDYNGVFKEYVSYARGVDPDSLPDPTAWSYVNCGWPIDSEEEFLELHAEAVRAGLYAKMKMNPWASDILHTLSESGVHISIVTARLTGGTHRRALIDTADFLEDNNIPYHDILFLNKKDRFLFDTIVEDSPGNIMTLRDPDNYNKVIIFDQLYNRHLNGPRARSWLDVGRLVSTAQRHFDQKWAWLND